MRDFIRILKLHQEFAEELVEQAIERALSYGCVHFDGVSSCLRQLREEQQEAKGQSMGDQTSSNAATQPETLSYPVDLSRYEQLLKLSW